MADFEIILNSDLRPTVGCGRESDCPTADFAALSSCDEQTGRAFRVG